MFEYYLSSQYRKAYEFIVSIGFLQVSAKVSDLDFLLLRKKFQITEELREISFVIKCFKVLAENRKKPGGMIKTLIFTHLLLQSHAEQTQQLKTLLKNQLNIILACSKQYRQKKQEKQIFKSRKLLKSETLDKISTNLPIFTQVDQSRPQFDENFGSSKNIGGLRTPSFNYDNINTPQSPTKSPTKQRKLSYQNNENIHQNHQFSSCKQFLCEKLIQPYACYLIKRIDSKLYNQNMNQQTILQQQYKQICIWSIINIYKVLLKIGQPFLQIVRYYDREYKSVVIHILQIMNHDIHQTYPTMVAKVKGMLLQNVDEINYDTIQEKVVIKSQKECPQNSQGKEKTKKFGEIKQILLQISEINQNLLGLFLNKWMADYLKAYDIKMPKLMPIQNQYCQFVFFKEQQKQKKMQKQKKKQAKIRKSLSSINSLTFQMSSMKYLPVEPCIQKKQPMTPIEIMKSRSKHKNSKYFGDETAAESRDLSTSLSKKVVKKQSDLPLKQSFNIDEYDGQIGHI